MRQTKKDKLEQLKMKFKGQTSRSNLDLEPELLLHPNIPKPLHTVTPRTIKGRAWWDVVRREAYNRMAYHCHACGHLGNRDKGDYLEAHEAYDIDYKTGRVTLKKIVALCKKCHRYIHSGHTEVMLRKGDITKAQYNEIKAHGFHVLAEAGLPPHRDGRDLFAHEICAWNDWYLELDGVRHYSPFDGYDDWEDYHRMKDGNMKRRSEFFSGPMDRPRSTLAGWLDHVLDKHHGDSMGFMDQEEW